MYPTRVRVFGALALDSSGEFAMKGLRIHRLLASTAAILLVAGMLVVNAIARGRGLCEKKARGSRDDVALAPQRAGCGVVRFLSVHGNGLRQWLRRAKVNAVGKLRQHAER